MKPLCGGSRRSSSKQALHPPPGGHAGMGEAERLWSVVSDYTSHVDTLELVE